MLQVSCEYKFKVANSYLLYLKKKKKKHPSVMFTQHRFIALQYCFLTSSFAPVVITTAASKSSWRYKVL